MRTRSFMGASIAVAITVIGIQIAAAAVLAGVGHLVSTRELRMVPLSSPTEVTLENFSWHKSMFSTALLVHFTLRNNASRTINNLMTRCLVYGSDGHEIGSTYQMINEFVYPHATFSLDEVNMGFVLALPWARRVNCFVADIDWQ